MRKITIADKTYKALFQFGKWIEKELGQKLSLGRLVGLFLEDGKEAVKSRLLDDKYGRPLENGGMDTKECINWISGRTETLLAGIEFRNHLRHVLSAIPLTELQALMKREITIFAPDPGMPGRTMRLQPWFCDGFFVYLSPALLKEGEARIRYVIAHELAHAFFGHEETPCRDAREEAKRGEEQADKKAKEWGFENPEKN